SSDLPRLMSVGGSMTNSPAVTALDFASAARARGPSDTRAKHSAALATITRNLFIAVPSKGLRRMLPDKDSLHADARSWAAVADRQPGFRAFFHHREILLDLSLAYNPRIRL